MPALNKFGRASKLFSFFGGEPKCRTLCGGEVPAERAGPSSLLTAYRPDSFSYILVPNDDQDQEKCIRSRELSVTDTIVQSFQIRLLYLAPLFTFTSFPLHSGVW